MLQSMGFSIGRLICVEMNPNTYTRLEFNLRRNFDCDVKCINAAVCGEKKNFLLHLGKGSTSDSLYHQNSTIDQGNARCFSINGMLFDDIFRMFFDETRDVIDLCKIDIEGAEYEVFLNHGHECVKKCRYLIMEIHNLENVNKAKVLMREIANLRFKEIAMDKERNVILFKNRAFESKLI